jgi:leucyl aminopeptidase
MKVFFLSFLFSRAGYKKQGSKGYVTVIQDSSKPMVNYIYMLAQAYISPNAQDSRVRFTKCGYGCSDQDSWITEGFQATGIAEAGPHDSDLNPNIHTRLDALNILDMEFLLLFAKVGLAYVVEMAL